MTKKLLLMLIGLLLLVYLGIGIYQNLQITYYTYYNSEIPTAFDQYRIIQISDFHCKTFGNKENKLINAINSFHPDIIVLTGDMIDGSHPDITPVNDLLSGISSIAPVYFVSGNHEFDTTASYTQLMQLFDTYGVINLDDSQAIISKNDSSFTLYGLSADRMDILFNQNALPVLDKSNFSIALYHYASHFDYFYNYGFDLVLAGHTHGGLIRLPLVGGIINNDGTLFPKYDAGKYMLGTTTMIVSRGLGDSTIPRFYNRPELVCITLQSSRE